MRSTVVKALRLPSTYKTRLFLKGNLPNGEYFELAKMLSSTEGHEAVHAKYTLEKGWQEINNEDFIETVREVFRL